MGFKKLSFRGDYVDFRIKNIIKDIKRYYIMMEGFIYEV